LPGDPQPCREYAKNCYRLAANAHTQESKAQFETLAQRLRIAADLEAAQALLEAWFGAPCGARANSKNELSSLPNEES
jgi:hypothetical protein